MDGASSILRGERPMGEGGNFSPYYDKISPLHGPSKWKRLHS